MKTLAVRPALTATRNGLPFAAPYTYRGTGRDELTAFMDDEPDPSFGTGRAASAQCGTTAGYRRHRRHGEPACQDCLAAERLRSYGRKSRWNAVHLDNGNGSPRCGVWNIRNPRMAGPGEEVTCTRCTGGAR